ncbi:glucokinase [Bradyrhizobium sp. HKCCYLS1011]|uniref:glucokinase n=1 Tax=Bradyrhizobium sp. HKCCYLS1011 TaxID=3420733 RepID=UPI003EC080D1
MSERVLLADIGGTNARFALMDRGVIGPIEHLKVADFPTIGDAIRSFLSQQAGGPPSAAVLDVAGTIEANRATLTNSHWVIDGADLARQFNLASAKLLNDFEAVGWSLPALQPVDLYPLGGGTTVAGAPMVVLGPGTGFGAACYLPGDGRPMVAVTEAGHVTLPATTERESQVIAKMRERLGHVSVERGALSGMGIEHTYQAIAAVDGADVPQRDAAEITQRALDGSCAVCRATLDMFCGWLGAVAGNLTLTFCARGGVYIAGGIAPRFPDYLARSDFRRQFENKGRYDAYLRLIPAYIVTKPDISFLGLKSFFETSAASPAR